MQCFLFSVLSFFQPFFLPAAISFTEYLLKNQFSFSFTACALRTEVKQYHDAELRLLPD